MSSPSATAQSPTAADLTPRNSKKPKRGRDMMEKPLPSSTEEMVQETPLSAGLNSPESVQWGTPVETPNPAWGKSIHADPINTEVCSDEEAMEEDKMDPNWPRIPVTKEEKERLRRPWRRSLILRVLGRKVSYSYLLHRLQKLWISEASFDLIALDQDYFVAKFESQRDYEFAKFEGPWIILGHYLTVQEWEPNFHPYKNKLSKLLVWARFPAIPIEYFEERFLLKIGKQIGCPVKVDTTTSLVSIGKFARVCIEVDLSKPLLSKFTLEDEVLPIEYEGINMVCFTCGIYGYKQGQCGNNRSEESLNEDNANLDLGQNRDHQASSEQEKNRQMNVPTRKFKGNFGAWMLVARKEKRGPRRNETSHPDQPRNYNTQKTAPAETVPGSRFAALNGLNEDGGGAVADERGTPSSFRYKAATLPRIRTNQANNRPRDQGNTTQYPPRNQNYQPVRNNTRGRGGRGGGPKRATAESEHTVIRGHNFGKQISSIVVFQEKEDVPESSHRAEFEFAFKENPGYKSSPC
ncbi:uncharacterized protein LOC116015840 [Ipomoea triloba]|uniref:uncharacterized protein LOC116015840 n=1 Tax=Ipomoea triloba TaxID=35885 RepID=UPI00125CD6B1|nr:uncharacterized protein LOC116015840 [Ipomoea triloba]